jgi:hypothetical protein
MGNETFRSWPLGIPPREWTRLLAIDVGGSSPWSWIWTAVDPWHNVVCYHELYQTTTSADLLVEKALPWMTYGEEKEEFLWKAKVIDYENKIAAEDLRRGGIVVTNARKHDKAASIERLKGYMHPNPKNHYPPWHPRAGQANAPRLFVMASCINLRREIPQARWLEQANVVKDEMDRRTGNHAVDCLLYTIRELPPAMELPVTPPMFQSTVRDVSKMSDLYWYDKKKHEEQVAKHPRHRGSVQLPLF